METEKAKTEFIKALNKVQGTLEPVAKDSSNPHFKSKYASLAAVNAAIMGPLAEAGFILIQGGVDIAGKAYLRTSLIHAGGHSESFDYPLVVDSNPQHIASSVTYARRYAICALLNLSIEDDDGNAASRPATTRVSEPVPQPQASSASQTKDEAVEVVFTPVKYGTKDFGEGQAKFTQYSVFDGTYYYSTKKMETGLVLRGATEKNEEVRLRYFQNGKYRNIASVSVVAKEEVPF